MTRKNRWLGSALRSVAVAALLAICPLIARAATWKDPTPEEKAIVEDEAHGRSGAIYLDRTFESREHEFTVSARAKILSRKGYSIGTIDNIAEDAVDIAGRTVGPSGLITELDKAEIRTMTTLKAGGSTRRRLGFTMPALEPGCFIEYTYREPGDFGSLGEYYADIAFQDRYSILHQELRTPSALRFSSSIRHAHGVDIRMDKRPGEVNYIADNIPALKEEPYGLPEEERRPGVIFSYFFEDLRATSAETYWKSAIRMVFMPYVTKNLSRPSKFKDVLKTIPGSRAENAQARLAALYRYVQTSFKNRDALAAGERPPTGGWKKNGDAADTLEHGSGSAEDLAALFVSLLRADGWTYRIVFVPDRERRLFHPEIPSAFQFDSWIVEVRDPTFREPVCLSFEHPELAYGQVPWNHLDVDSLQIDLDTGLGAKVRMPSGSAARNAENRASTLTIAPDGGVRIEETSRWSGLKAFDERVRVFQLGPGANEKATREELRKLDPPEELESLSYEHTDDPNVELVSHARAKKRMALMPTATDRVLMSPLSGTAAANPFTAPTRTEPIHFPYAYVETDTVKLIPPPDCRFLAVPEAIEKSSSAGHYAVRASANADGSISVERVFELSAPAAGAEAYDEYRKLFEGAARGDEDFTIAMERIRNTPGKSKS